MEKYLLDLLICPETREKLSPAPQATVDRLNAAIEAGTLKNRGGVPVKARMEAALQRADGKFVYPVADGIPNVIIDEAIPLEVA